MDAKETKSLSPLRILQILQEHSDFEHRLTQEQIASYLERDYGLVLERKAIGRKLATLKQAGFSIEWDRRGSCLTEREFTESELRLLIDGVLCSNYIEPRQSRALIQKLCNLASKHFRANVSHIHSVSDWDKTENAELFLNIELLGEAIDNHRQVTFTYNKYSTDKALHPTAVHQVSPYQLILKNQRYYLMALNERWGNMTCYRLDRITKMDICDQKRTPITSVKGYEKGLDLRRFSQSMPYMFTDTPETVVFLADEQILDQVIDWFGKDISIRPEGKQLRITAKISPIGMEFWAMQYLKHVEILSPQSLREKIAENLKAAEEKYR